MDTLTDGTIHVFTFKEGLLSKVAHDLRLSLSRFEIRLDGDAVEATLWPASLAVDGAVENGRLRPDGVSGKDKNDIHGNATGPKILDVARHPTVEFRGARRGDRVEGTLRLAGREAPLAFPVTEADGRAAGSFELVPSRWGIKPFKALMGAIRLQDRVQVVFDVALPG
ncbi:MAG: YceI family protein [Myxococcales bacterium]|nr:YceI family protein [Myxococcales bacterium]MCB9536051.1 YceI family protein [Myxococcales bacterium]